MKVLGTPLGHRDFVRIHLKGTTAGHQLLMDRIPLLWDLQSSWLSRVVERDAVQEFCRRHDAAVWRCFCTFTQIEESQPRDVRATASMPLVLGGFGLRSASRTSKPAYWAIWADCLSMVQRRHPHVAAALVTELQGSPTSPSLQAASQCRAELTGKMGFVPPSWDALAHGERPLLREPEDREPGMSQRGWQHEACTHVEGACREKLFALLPNQTRPLIRSQAAPGAGAALMVFPTNRQTTMPSHLFRVVLLRRLRHALALSVRSCRCGPCGHHRAACAQAGMLGRRGYALESIMARICREAGGRVRTNLMVRDMDVPVPVAVDSRRLEVVVDGLPVRGGA